MILGAAVLVREVLGVILRQDGVTIQTLNLRIAGNKLQILPVQEPLGALGKMINGARKNAK